MLERLGPDEGKTHLRDATESEFYLAKRKAAAVLGHRVRPGDLPSDSEVREQTLELLRNRTDKPTDETNPEPDEDENLERLADHVDRFVLYKMRLMPLEAVKLNPKTHPEGDALYHSLQVFERAREIRPYDEEFLLAALLHEVARGVEQANRSAAIVEALSGSVTERTIWLILNHQTKDQTGAKPPTPPTDSPEWLEDLKTLREVDLAGRVAAAVVGTLEQALDYLRGLESEAYLDAD